jgi:nucleotide-binding universal stress UspA family protein
MSILVATDFSPCSRAAVRLAAAIARRRGVPLVLVHAVEPPSVDLFAIPAGSAGWQADLISAAEVALARDASDIRQTGIAAEGRVLLGPAGSVILDSARDNAAELIVVGTHGRRGGAHLFLGSVSESVVRSSLCPVLVTPDVASDADRWEGRLPLRLIAAMDGSSASHAAVSWAGALAKVQPCDLSLVRLYWPPEEATRLGVGDPWGGPRRDAELLPLLERDLRRDAQALVGEVPSRLRYRAAGREAAEVLAEEAAMFAADAVVIGVPRRRPPRWTVLAPGLVLRSSPVPVLCVPETLAPATRQIPQVGSVLIATDLSEASKAALLPAYALLRAGGGAAEICYVNVLGPVDALAETPLGLPLHDAQRAELEADLRALIPPDAEAAGITSRVSVVDGRFAAEAILAAAERLDVDVIAVGSHGRSGFKRALLGSVAEELARRSPRPVLIVRSGAGGAAA